MKNYELGLTAVARRDGTASILVWCVDRSGDRHNLRRVDCPTGRPTPGQLADILATLEDEAQSTLITALGVQGVLLA